MGAQTIIKEIIADNVLGFGLTALGTILTIFSTFFAIYVYRKDKIKKREFDEIAKIVGENIDLTDKSDKIKELSKQIEELNKTINDIIPLKAKKAALQDRLDGALLELANCYNNVLEINEELQIYENGCGKVSNELIDIVSHEIEPKYLHNEKLSKYTSILFLTSFISNIVFSITIFHVFEELFSVIFSIVEIVYIYKIIKEYYNMKNIEMLRYISIILIICSVILLLAIIAVIFEIFHAQYGLISFLCALILGELFCIYTLYIIQKKYNLK